MQQITSYLTEARCVELQATDKEGALAELAAVAVNDNPSLHSTTRQLFEEIMSREKLMSTGIGIGIAVPHTRCPETETFTIAVGRSRHGINYDSLDNQPVKLVVLIISPADDRKLYLQLLARVVMLLKDKTFFASLLDAPKASDMFKLIAQDA